MSAGLVGLSGGGMLDKNAPSVFSVSFRLFRCFSFRIAARAEHKLRCVLALC
jgi:hypothetical protein